MKKRKGIGLPPPGDIALLWLGTAVLSFGLYFVHRPSGISEGGVLGMVLLLNHHFDMPAHVMTPVLDGLCYWLGWRFLGWEFLKRSAIATLGMTIFYKLWSVCPPLMPDLAAYPLMAAVVGGVFVGVGVGIVVRRGGSSGGDDALALAIAKATGLRLAKAYMFTDFTVLALSLTYIPAERILYSLLTVCLSSWIIDRISR